MRLGRIAWPFVPRSLFLLPRPVRAVLQASVAAALLLLIVVSTDVSEIARVLGTVDSSLLAGGFLAYASAHALFAFSLRELLSGLAPTLTMSTVLVNYYEGAFFAQFFPTSAGGDVYRVLHLAPFVGDKTTTALAVGAHRVIALYTLCLIASVATLALHSFGTVPLRSSEIIVAVTLVPFVAVAVAIILGRLGQSWFASRTAVVGEGYRRVKQIVGSGRFRNAFFATVAYQLMTVAAAALLAQSLHIDLTWWHFTYVVPLSTLAAMLPVSLNGLGIRESMYVLLLSSLGVAREQAATLALLVLGVALTSAAVGGLMFTCRSLRRV